VSARFFIDRPIFAAVLSIVITLAGAVAAFQLPISQYPPIAPPTIQIDCNYPGASAQVVAQTVAAPIEQQVNGVEGMLYMASQSTNEGSYSLQVTFDLGVDLNVAQVLVQNRVNLAMPQLPDVVRQTGVTMRKRSSEILLIGSLNSPDGRYDQLFLSNYGLINVRDELLRIPGISEVILFGQRDYSMRIWVDPEKLAARNLTAGDVVAAVREQNLQVAAGYIGQSPVHSKQPFHLTLTTRGRLTEAADFEDMIVKATADGKMIRVKDVGRVQLGAKNEDINQRYDGRPMIGLAVFLLSDANALETADRVKAKLVDLSRSFPEGMQYDIGYDTTPFIRESIWEVFKSLGDSILLVAAVVLVFLQGWRAAVIPLIAVPVAIIGTFAALALFGFSMNNLTLFGLVLAIGIVVDDAIVVVEAVEHQIERGLAPREAAIRAMEEVTAPVIAIGVVLSAVFIPCAFLSGIVGQFFRQFALTIAVSTLISTFNSLTLSPALAALLLRSPSTRPDVVTRIVDFTLGWFFRLFNASFQWVTESYLRLVGRLLRGSAVVAVAYVGLCGLTIWETQRLPRGFIPLQDKGYLLASVQLPDNASAGRSNAVMQKLSDICLSTPGIAHVNSVSGNAFLLNAYGSNFGSMFIILDEFAQRRSPELYGERIQSTLRDKFAKEIPEAIVNVFMPPAVSGLGRMGGFKVMVEDRSDAGLLALQAQTDNLVARGNEQPELTGLFTIFKADSPQLFVDVNRTECMSQGIVLGDVFGSLQTFLGSRYVNDFNRFGRTWQVAVQADAHFRNDVDDFKKLRVRNKFGQMVPMGTIASVREIRGPSVLTRYNMYPAGTITGNASPGTSTGQAMAAVERLADRELPSSMAHEWSEITYIERLSRNTGTIVFGFSVVFVFLVLAALYESWALPLAVILVVPMCVLGAVSGVAATDSDINVFTQVGFVVLIGLASKNAILIVEFAKLLREEGEDRRQAILHACRLRLRPILMTSFAFVLGVLPLVFAQGAGAEMRRSLGTAVFSGMLGVTLFGIVLTPVAFWIVDSISQGNMLRAPWWRAGWRLPAIPQRLRGRFVRRSKGSSSFNPIDAPPVGPTEM
jgi:multidrug efflux pump